MLRKQPKYTFYLWKINDLKHMFANFKISFLEVETGHYCRKSCIIKSIILCLTYFEINHTKYEKVNDI